MIKNVDEIVVCTDNNEIKKLIEPHNVTVKMTPKIIKMELIE